MRYLLDTHCWLWWLTEPERLSQEAFSCIEDPGNEILLSTASTWEIAIKYAIGKLPLPSPPEEYIISRVERCAFSTLKVEHRHAARVATLPLFHRDPFDRLLIAQAIVEKVPIVTADSQFNLYDVTVVKAR